MCGVFGAIGSLDNAILQEIAAEAKKRGPHAYGISWLSNDSICTQKAAQAINPKEAFKRIDTKAIIGHCRLSTSGSYKDVTNNQPIVLNNLALAHNGNIRSYLQIASDIGVRLATNCDSEIIGHMIQRMGVENTLIHLENEMPMALLLLQNNKITVFRNGLPVYMLRTDGAIYFCSRKFRTAEIVQEGRILEFSIEGGAICR